MYGRLLTILFILVGLIVSVLAYFWISDQILSSPLPPIVPQTLPPDATQPGAYWRPISLFGLMLIGIVVSTIYEHFKELQAGKKRFKLGDLVANFGSNPRLWMAICVSPIVFFVTYQAIAELPDNTVAMFYAFQNGFFWEAIFSSTRR